MKNDESNSLPRPPPLRRGIRDCEIMKSGGKIGLVYIMIVDVFKSAQGQSLPRALNGKYIEME